MPEGNAPESLDDFFERLRTENERLPKRLRQCAEYVAANPDRLAVSTVAELADAADVQPSAFMRFCQEMGFSGFSQMQKLFRTGYTPKWPDYKTRLAKLREHGTESPATLLAEFVDAGRHSLDNLLSSIDPDALNKATDVLGAARTLHIVGYRRAFPVASYLCYAFEKMGIPAVLHTSIGNMTTDHLLQPDDALIAITFAPYTSQTIETARVATDKGLELVAITDVVTSPLAQLDATLLMVSEYDVGAFRALSASLSLAITLAVSVGARRNAL